MTTKQPISPPSRPVIKEVRLPRIHRTEPFPDEWAVPQGPRPIGTGTCRACGALFPRTHRVMYCSPEHYLAGCAEVYQDATSCWNWLKPLANGYGHANWHGRAIDAHRLAYEVFKGPIRDDLWVLHACDNPACINPAHLRVGTPLENAFDRVLRGRTRYPGAVNPWTKLTIEEARYAKFCGEPAKVVAHRLGVTPVAIWDIRRGHTWVHVQETPEPVKASDPPSQPRLGTRWCKICGVEFRPHGDTVKTCSDGCYFKSRYVILPGKDPCWVWDAASTARNDYGQMTRHGRPIKAHVFAWTLHHGTIPKGMFVCHHCDNRPCVRPDHLYLGTPLQNARDMVRRNREPVAAEKKGTKLNPEKVADIYTNPGSATEMMAKHDISRQVVSMIRKDRIWTRVTAGLRVSAGHRPRVTTSRLTVTQILAIAASDQPAAELAAKYEISINYISMIRGGRAQTGVTRLKPKGH